MGLVYLPIYIFPVDFYGFHVGKYTIHPMDPMRWKILDSPTLNNSPWMSCPSHLVCKVKMWGDPERPKNEQLWLVKPPCYTLCTLPSQTSYG